MVSGTTETILTMTHASLFSGIGGFDLGVSFIAGLLIVSAAKC